MTIENNIQGELISEPIANTATSNVPAIEGINIEGINLEANEKIDTISDNKQIAADNMLDNDTLKILMDRISQMESSQQKILEEHSKEKENLAQEIKQLKDNAVVSSGIDKEELVKEIYQSAKHKADQDRLKEEEYRNNTKYLEEFSKKMKDRKIQNKEEFEKCFLADLNTSVFHNLNLDIETKKRLTQNFRNTMLINFADKIVASTIQNVSSDTAVVTKPKEAKKPVIVDDYKDRDTLILERARQEMVKNRYSA